MSFCTTILTYLLSFYNFLLTTITIGAKLAFAIITFTFTLHYFVAVVLHATTITYKQVLDQSHVEYTTTLRPCQEDDLCHWFDQMAIEEEEEFWEQCRLRVAFLEMRRAREESWGWAEVRPCEVIREKGGLEKEGWKTWGLGLLGRKEVTYCLNGEFGTTDW
jgi:hypothetical protein